MGGLICELYFSHIKLQLGWSWAEFPVTAQYLWVVDRKLIWVGGVYG